MNPNICNNCGGDYEYRNGRWICRSCGSYKPEEISNEEVTLLYMAYQKLRLADFYEAEPEFDDIIQKYPQNPNAYWGRLMAKYGIKYERDYDGKMIPTCYAASIQSVMEDADYQKALKYADAESKVYYRTQAEYIERVRREWIEKASKEKPYDVFICYKDSDLANGIARTKDSIAAQDIYTYLTDLGYHVFYSHVSLQNKVGEKYEPYIFNALSTAKVMLVYGSSPEYITSTWLKNEWTRYEKRIQAGEKKPNSLLVACEGFSPGELPHTLSSRQCFDATDKRFYKNLEETIKNIIRPEEEKETAVPVLQAPKKKKGFLPFVIIVALLAMGGIGYLIWNSLTACNHVAMVDAAVEPTCTQEGLTEGTHCRLCGETLIEQTPIQKTEHTPGKEATCTTAQSCTVCGTELTAALGHTPGTAATCSTSQNCEVCYIKLTAALGHTPGTDGKCTVCGKNTDSESGSVGFRYSVNGDRTTCTITGIGECTDANLIIPSAIDGYKVTRIDDFAFTNCTNLKSVDIGDSVNIIGQSAFFGCSDLTNVTLGNGLTNICEKAFFSCSNLTSIIIPDNVVGIGKEVFKSCEQLTTVIIGNGVVSIEQEAFSNCSKLTDIRIGNGVTKIAIGAFMNCTNLKNIDIPYGVRTIESDAFWACSALTKIILPNSITSLGDTVFHDCFALKSAILPDSITKIGNGMFSYCGSLESVSLPNNIKIIDIYMFRGCNSLTNITIPNSVTNIATEAFINCNSLQSIMIPANVLSIGSEAFRDCSDLKNIEFGGTTAQWNAMTKYPTWSYNVPATKVICSDGEVSLK